MIISIRTHKNTQFTLYWSKVNSCFIFRRTDNGAETQVTLLTDCKNKTEAQHYFADKVEFYCSVQGISVFDMVKG